MSSPESVDWSGESELPEYASRWESSDGLLVMTVIDIQYAMNNLTDETKDRAKAAGLLMMDRYGDELTLILTDDPDEYGDPLATFGLEEYLKMRLRDALR